MVLKLNKNLCGSKSAPRNWFNFLKENLEACAFVQQTEVDPCLFISEKVICVMYVDDCLIIGPKNDVDKCLIDIERFFDIKKSNQIDTFIGCKIKRIDNRILLSQPELIEKLLFVFKEDIKSGRDCKTPAGAGTKVMRPENNEGLLDDKQQSKYRSGVGSLLYLLKHSRPDLANSVRELSKVMDGATKAHWKMLLRIIRFVEKTKNYELILEPKRQGLNWELRGYCDSDYAGDADTRISVSGFVIYINGCLVSWKSKGQRSVVLSSTEAEYVAISE